MIDHDTTAFDVDAVSPALLRRFAVTVGLTEVDPRPGAAVPFGLHWCLAPDAAPLGDLSGDGLATTAGAILPPPEGFSFTMWAGADVTVLAPLRIGDTVSRRTRILDVTEKAGRSGRLAFGRVEQIFSVEGEDRIVASLCHAVLLVVLLAGPMPSRLPPGAWQVPSSRRP